MGQSAGQLGVYRLVSQGFPLGALEKKLTEKGIFAGTPDRCPGDTRPSRVFSDSLCEFFLCAFSAL